jgi:hypothetical protein
MWKVDKWNKKLNLLILMAQSSFCNHMNLSFSKLVESYKILIEWMCEKLFVAIK